MVNIDYTWMINFLKDAGLVCGFLITIYKFMFVPYIKSLKKTEQNGCDIISMKEDMRHSRETQGLIIEGILGICDGLHQLGCNGNVTKTENQLKEYLIEQYKDQ